MDEGLSNRYFFENNQKTSQERKINSRLGYKKIIADTSLGDMKKGVLSGVRVYKFKVADKQYLLAYRIEKRPAIVILLALGSHEYFYRDLSK